MIIYSSISPPLLLKNPGLQRVFPQALAVEVPRLQHRGGQLTSFVLLSLKRMGNVVDGEAQKMVG